jgi:hypothetical protein
MLNLIKPLLPLKNLSVNKFEGEPLCSCISGFGPGQQAEILYETDVFEFVLSIAVAVNMYGPLLVAFQMTSL